MKPMGVDDLLRFIAADGPQTTRSTVHLQPDATFTRQTALATCDWSSGIGRGSWSAASARGSLLEHPGYAARHASDRLRSDGDSDTRGSATPSAHARPLRTRPATACLKNLQPTWRFSRQFFPGSGGLQRSQADSRTVPSAAARRHNRLQIRHIRRNNGGGGIRTLVRGKPPETVFEYAARATNSPRLLGFLASP
jgi:hypothetical protein